MEIVWASFWKVVGIIPGVLKIVGPLVDRQKYARIADDIAKLAFWSDGMLGPLTQIAAGDTDQANFDRLKLYFSGSEQGARDAILRLGHKRSNLIASEMGMKIARDLDKTVNIKMGIGGIRFEIKKYIERGSIPQSAAKEIVQEINVFNKKLDGLHEQIRPKRSALNIITNVPK